MNALGNGIKPEISTTAYEFAHGKRPRGRGHWLFWIRPYRGAPDSKSELFAGFSPGEKTYSAARDDAVCRAYDLHAGERHVVVEVAS